MRNDHRRLGVGVALLGLLALLTLRFWASPLTSAAVGRDRVGLVPFLAIPLLLIVVGAGIAVAIWGDDLGLT